MKQKMIEDYLYEFAKEKAIKGTYPILVSILIKLESKNIVLKLSYISGIKEEYETNIPRNILKNVDIYEITKNINSRLYAYTIMDSNRDTTYTDIKLLRKGEKIENGYCLKYDTIILYYNNNDNYNRFDIFGYPSHTIDIEYVYKILKDKIENNKKESKTIIDTSNIEDKEKIKDAIELIKLDEKVY